MGRILCDKKSFSEAKIAKAHALIKAGNLTSRTPVCCSGMGFMQRDYVFKSSHKSRTYDDPKFLSLTC
jgi:hypothetical protein